MKRNITHIAILLCLIILCMMFVACSNTSDDLTFYTVSFETNGGSTIESLLIEESSLIVQPANPLKNGYIFIGWYTDPNCYTEWNFYTDKVNEDIVLYAKWIEDISHTTTYIVSFNTCGGSLVDSITVDEGDIINEPMVPTREGYIFDGWYKDDSFLIKWDFELDTVNNDITLYANWIEEVKQEYIVTFVLGFDDDEGNPIMEEIETIDGLIADFIPSRDGYVFNGWWVSSATGPNGEPTMSSQWDFNNIIEEDGLILYAEWYEKSNQVGALNAPTVTSEGYVYSWEEIEGASGYEIYLLKGTEEIHHIEETLERTYTFNASFSSGTYTLKIRAYGDGHTTINSPFVYKYIYHKQVGAIIEIEYDESTSILRWTAASNADKYDIYTNGDCSFSDYDKTYISLANFDASTYSIEIIAHRDGWESSSKRITINKRTLAIPQNLTCAFDNTNGKYLLRWNSVLNADQFIVYINGEEYERVGEREFVLNLDHFDIKDVELMIEVQAFNSKRDYFASNKTSALTCKKPLFVSASLQNEKGGVCAIMIDDKDVNNTYIKYGQEYSVKFDNFLGYEAKGIYIGDELITEDNTYLATADSSVEYVCSIKIREDLAIFTVKSTYNTCTITGVVDDTIEAVVIPDCVTRIDGTFFGSALKSVIISENSQLTSISNEALVHCDLNYNEYENGCYIGSVSNPYMILLKAKSYDITSCVIHEDTELVRPNAFYGTDKTLQYNIKNNVKYVGKASNPYYFLFDASLYNDIDNDTEIIGSYAFSNSNITSIYIPTSVKVIGAYAFENCDELTTVSFSSYSRLVSIERGGFSGCENLKSLNIPDGVQYIGAGAFASCLRIDSISIPKSTERLDDAFSSHYYLSNISVDEENLIYSSSGNCLIDKTTKTLIRGGRNSVIPSDGSVVIIGEDAFKGCTFESISIPNQITRICRDAFWDCYLLSYIYIPNSVEYLGSGVFYECSDLERINFGGTMEEWNSIEKIDTLYGTLYGSSITYVWCNDGRVSVN